MPPRKQRGEFTTSEISRRINELRELTDAQHEMAEAARDCDRANRAEEGALAGPRLLAAQEGDRLARAGSAGVEICGELDPEHVPALLRSTMWKA